MAHPSAAQPQGNAALEKGLILLSRILQDRGRTKLSTLVQDMHLPRSTLYRLAATLEARGMIARVAQGQYDIGLALAGRMEGVSAQGQLARVGRPVLRALARSCRATAHLGVMDGDMVTYLVKESRQGLPAGCCFTRENSQLEAYCSGIGKVLLASLPPLEQARFLAGGPFVALTPRTLTDAGALASCLAAVASRGFARDDGEIADDLYCLAVPIRDRGNQVQAAISLSFPRHDRRPFDDDAYIARLRAGASELSLKLGGSLAETAA